MKINFIKSFICILILLVISVNSREDNDKKEGKGIFDSIRFNPFEIIFSLVKMKLMSADSDFSCTLCQRVVKAVTSTIVEKYDIDDILYHFELICTVIFNKDVCEFYILNYGPTIFETLIVKKLNEENLCHSLGFCFDGEEVEDPYDFAIRILKDKPKNKTKEPIDYNAPQIKMIQFTDIHLDVHYKENASVYCDEPACCRTPASQYARKKSGYYGYLGCDSNLRLIETFADKAYELQPDIIIWTGDNSPHNNLGGSIQENYDVTVAIRDLINERFNHSVTVYPVLGNHEPFPPDKLTDDIEEIYQQYAEIYKDYFTEDQAYESFRKYGYYTEKYLDTNLRFVVLNCLLCDAFDFYITIGHHEEARQEFAWLEKVLRQAEKDGEYVYILDHFPINAEFHLTECSKRLIAIYDRFEYIIRGYFSGHTHLDDIAPIRGYFEPRPIININYIAPPLSTFHGKQPSFRQFIIDSNTKNIINYEQYRLNITDANLNKIPNWYINYYATDKFNVTDLTDLQKIFQINVDGDYLVQRYAEGKKPEKLIHNKKEVRKAQCQIENDNYHDYYICAADTVFDVAYFFEFLNEISGEWALSPK